MQGASLLEAAARRPPTWPPRGAGVPGPTGGGRRRGPGLPPPPRRRRDPGTAGEGAQREDRAQRAVLVRERQEVQALPWRGLRPPGPARATSATSGGSWRRCASASKKPRGTWASSSCGCAAPSSRRRRRDPDLWDDPDQARRVTSEFSSVNDDIAMLEDLDAEPVGCRGAPRADHRGVRRLASHPSSPRRSTTLARRMSELELRSLFAGEYDERDAIGELHAGAGGTDAQDWCEMMLRMYLRWAERRGFAFEVDEATEGQEAGLLSATFIVKGRFAYGLLSAERGVHRLVRMSPFDSQHRRQTSFATVDVIPFLEDAADRDRHRRQGPAHRHLPLFGGRWPARQQDRLGGAPHPPAHRDRGVVPERAQPAPEQGARPCRSWRPSSPSSSGPSAGPSSTRCRAPKADDAWGSQIRSYVMAPYQMVKDHRTGVRDGQRRRRARR